MLDDLQGRSVRSGAVRLLAQGFQTIVAVGTGAALARLLTPADFGVYAMAFTLIGFVSWFRDFGLPLALTQRDVLTDSAARAIFVTGIKLTGGLVLFIVLMAPVVAAFYDEPRVRLAALIMSTGVLALGFAIVPEGLLIRRMRFGALATIETASGLAGMAVAVVAALNGAGYWALVCQFMALTLVKSAGVCFVSDWRFRRSKTDAHTSPASAAEAASSSGAMFRYGRDLTAARIVRYFGVNADRILIGRFHGSAALGLYDNALRWSRYPLRQVFMPLQTVFVSTLSRVAGNPARYRNAFQKGTLPIYTVLVPMLVYLLLDAPAVVLVLLGDQWLDAVPLFRLLSLAALGQSLRRATDWLYLSEGRTDSQLRWNGIAAGVQIACVVIGLRWGSVGVAAGFAIASWLLVVPDILYCTRGSLLSARDFLPMTWRPLIAASVGGVLALLVWPELLSNSPTVASEGAALRGVLQRLPAFVAAYTVVWVGLPGGRAALRDVLALASLLGAASSGRRGRNRPEDQAESVSSDT